MLRYFGEDGRRDRLLLVNFGPDLHLDPPRAAAGPAGRPPVGGAAGDRRAALRRLGRGAAGHRDRRLVHDRPLRDVLRPAPAEEATVLTRMIHAGSART